MVRGNSPLQGIIKCFSSSNPALLSIWSGKMAMFEISPCLLELVKRPFLVINYALKQKPSFFVLLTPWNAFKKSLKLSIQLKLTECSKKCQRHKVVED